MRLVPIAACCVLAAASASAEPATPEGAKALAQSYAAYLSPKALEKGIVTVTPDGDDYAVSWDVEKALAALGARPGAVRMAPFVYRVAPTPGGGWLARASALPGLTIAPSQEGGRDGGTVGFDGFRFDGLYDAAAAEFFRGKLGLDAVKADVKAKSGDDLQHVRMSYDALGAEIRIKPGADADSVDVALPQSLNGASQQTALVDGDKEAPLTDTRQGAAVGDSAATGLRAKAFGDLWRFLVAHADEDKPPAEELKAKLTALLPLWRELSDKVDVDDVAVSFPGGSLSFKSVSETARMTGLAEESSLALTLGFKQIDAEAPSAPDWVRSVWPASLTLTLEAGVDGLDKAAKLALDDPDFVSNGKLGDEAQNAIAELLTQGRPHVSLSAGLLSTPLVEATFEGDASFGEEGPEAHAKITADTLDKVLETLAKAVEKQPSAQQALYLATFARGLAKTEDGRMVWDIEYLGANSVEVNGQKFPPQ